MIGAAAPLSGAIVPQAGGALEFANLLTEGLTGQATSATSTGLFMPNQPIHVDLSNFGQGKDDGVVGKVFGDSIAQLPSTTGGQILIGLAIGLILMNVKK